MLLPLTIVSLKWEITVAIDLLTMKVMSGKHVCKIITEKCKNFLKLGFIHSKDSNI